MHLVKDKGSIMKYDGLIGEDSSKGDGSIIFLKLRDQWYLNSLLMS